MSHAEFVEWAAFAATEPLPAMRADLHTAMIMLLTATIHQGKRGKKLKLDDFVTDFWDDKSRPEVLARKLQALALTPSTQDAPARDRTRA